MPTRVVESAPTRTVAGAIRGLTNVGYAVAIVALIMFQGPAAEASTVQCGFGGAQPSCVNGNSAFFIFDVAPDAPFALRLDFDQVNGPFFVDVTDVLVTQASLVSNARLNGFPGFTCVPIADGSQCVEFQVSGSAPGPNTWEGSFDVTLLWSVDTTQSFPNEPVDSKGLGRIRVLYSPASVAGQAFDQDITIPGSYTECAQCLPDPGIGGRGTAFGSFLAAQAPSGGPVPVPEPATVFLLGAGLTLASGRAISNRQPRD